MVLYMLTEKTDYEETNLVSKHYTHYLPTPEEEEVDPETSSPDRLAGGNEVEDPEATDGEPSTAGATSLATGAARGGRSSRSVGSGMLTGLAFPKGLGLGAGGG